MRAVPSLRRIREDQALSQRELAEKAGVAVDTISELERREREAQPRTIQKLARALGVEPIELMREEK
jgi:transcriptional regulator with XRE-family HTH domain